MVKLHLELEGDVDEVVRALRRIGGGDNAGGEVRDGLRPAPTEERTAAVHTVPEPGQRQLLERWCPGHWTQELAADFTASLDVVAGRVLWHVWRAGERGIHRNTLCQRTDLSPVELRSLLIRLGRVRGRFQRERGMALSRPMAANSPLRSYFIDPEFARWRPVCSTRGCRTSCQWLAAPLKNACHRAPGRANRASVVEHAADNDAPIDVKLRC